MDLVFVFDAFFEIDVIDIGKTHMDDSVRTDDAGSGDTDHIDRLIFDEDGIDDIVQILIVSRWFNDEVLIHDLPVFV